MTTPFSFRTLRFFLGLGLLSLVVSCNTPVSGATTYSSGPQVSGLPMGGGLTVYVGMVNKDSYHTGLMVYPNGGSQWNQLLSTAATVNDISIDSSGNIAVAEPTSVWYYTKSSGVWTSATTTGTANQVSLGGTGATATLFVATTSGFFTSAVTSLSLGAAALATNATSVWGTSSTTGYLGTASGLYSISGTTTTNPVVTSSAVSSSTINGIYYVNASQIYAATSVGFSLYNGAWADTLSSAIGVGTPLCVYYYGGTIYLGTTSGVATSSNNGTSWSTANLASPVYSIAAATANGNTSIYAATPAGLYIYSTGSSVVQSGWSVVFSGYRVNKVAVTIP